ncbi:MAG: nucleotide exchange factor GrpE [Verrucomicrobiia bacterium]
MKKADSHTKKTDTNPAIIGPPDAVAHDPADRGATTAEITPEQLAEIKARAAKADEYWDRLLRTTADFENFKKRAARERNEAALSAAATLIHKLLPVLDHFEMAQTAAQTAQGDKLAALQDGIAMIQQQLKGILAETGLEDVDANGQTFDPMLHEAVSQLETADAPEGQVVQQIRKGYKMRERLLRPATVVVAKKPAAPPATPPAA